MSERNIRLIEEAAKHPFISAETHPNVTGAIEHIVSREGEVQDKVDGILLLVNLIVMELKLKMGPPPKYMVHRK